jgi:hypothetical protein
MNLEDLLSELREGILHDRSDRIEGSSDYLWTDASLVRYIDEAQRRLCRLGLVIRDSTTAEVVQVTMVAGQDQYTLHESVIAVVSGRYDDDANDLARSGHSIFNQFRQPNIHDFGTYPATTQTGRPLAFSTDEETAADDNETRTRVVLRVYPTPTSAEAGDILHLRVCRYPLERLNVKRLKLYPEVPEEHHIEMLDWAAYLALRIVDQDAGSPVRANEFRASFEDHARRARSNTMRKMFAPTGWAFGRGGYSWER